VTLGWRRLKNWFSALPTWDVVSGSVGSYTMLYRYAYDGEEEADAPHPPGVDGQRGIVDGRHDGAHLGEGRVVGLVGEDLVGVAVVDDAPVGVDIDLRALSSVSRVQ